MSEMICPYCEKDIPAPEEQRDQNTCYSTECPECGKTFVFWVEYYPSYTEEKAPCLNGGEHDWQPICGAPAEYFANRRRCSYCQEEKELEPRL